MLSVHDVDEDGNGDDDSDDSDSQGVNDLSDCSKACPF
jgi:hypothetical protein